MNLVWLLLAAVAVFAFCLYIRLPMWFDIPKNPFSPRLRTSDHAYERFPRWLQTLYERNLAWRRNVSLRRSYRRTGVKLDAPPLSEADLQALESVLGHELDPLMRLQLTDPKL